MIDICIFEETYRSVNYKMMLSADTRDYYARIENPHSYGFCLISARSPIYNIAKWEAVRMIELMLEEQPPILEAAA